MGTKTLNIQERRALLTDLEGLAERMEAYASCSSLDAETVRAAAALIVSQQAEFQDLREYSNMQASIISKRVDAREVAA